MYVTNSQSDRMLRNEYDQVPKRFSLLKMHFLYDALC